MRVIYRYKQYKILATKHKYVIVNTLGKYENHAHFKKLDTAFTVLKMIKRQKVPNSKYLKQSIIRISLDKKYNDKILKESVKNGNDT